MNRFLAIEAELQKRRIQCDGTKSKNTPYRVEFRYPGGTKHWQYFFTVSGARAAEDSQCYYNPFGIAIIGKPLSQVIQVRGPRGGWRKLEAAHD